MISDSYKAKKKKRDGFIVLVVGRTMLFAGGVEYQPALK